MRMRMIRTTFFVCISTLISLPVLAQSTTTSGVKGTTGADTHLKSHSLDNAPGVKAAPPASKGGPAAKGAYGTCNLHIDNRTPLIVQFYFNGSLSGVIGRYGDLYSNMTPGSAQLYGIATFTDGSSLTFGPLNYACAGTDYTWTLTP